MNEPGLDLLESVIWANLRCLSSPDTRTRECAIACVRAAARDYADLRRTETLPDDVRTAAEHALRLAGSAPDAPSPELAAFRRYVLGQAVAAQLGAVMSRAGKARTLHAVPAADDTEGMRASA